MPSKLSHYFEPPEVRSHDDLLRYLVWLSIRSTQITFPFNVLNVLKAYSEANLFSLVCLTGYLLAAVFTVYLLVKFKSRFLVLTTYINLIAGLLTIVGAVYADASQAFVLVLWLPSIFLVIHYFTYQIDRLAFFVLYFLASVVSIYVLKMMPLNSTVTDVVNFKIQMGFSLATCLVWMSLYLTSRFKVQKSLMLSLDQEKDLALTLNRIISHDLANSLNIAMNAALMIRLKPDDYLKSLEKIERSTSQMRDIVKSCRNLSLIGSSKGQKLNVACSLNHVVSEVLQDYNERIASKEIQLVFSHQVEAMVYADPQILRNNIVANLISNAIKFSPSRGKLEITINKTSDRASVVVRDFGIGMPKQLLMDVFDMQKSTSRKGTEGETGTGFGLPIVKKILEKMNAEIGISSVEGEGTEVTLTFPLAS